MRTIAFIVGISLALALVPSAAAWSWPVDGPLLKPFALGSDPYAGGQHRGIDVGAAAGEDVRAPTGGTVTFGGAVPGSGRTVTITTPDGYAVTLTHLGAVSVVRDVTVGEGDVVGVAGTSGEVEWPRPYVHLGVRLASDPHGYVDPLAFLPLRSPQPAPDPTPPDVPAPVPAPEGAPPEGAPPDGVESSDPPQPVEEQPAVVEQAPSLGSDLVPRADQAPTQSSPSDPPPQAAPSPAAPRRATRPSRRGAARAARGDSAGAAQQSGTASRSAGRTDFRSGPAARTAV